MSRLRADDYRTALSERSVKWRRVRISCVLVLASFIGMASALAGDIDTFPATSIDASHGEATLFSHENVLLGLSCKSGPIRKLSGLSTVSIGDTLLTESIPFAQRLLRYPSSKEIFALVAVRSREGRRSLCISGESTCSPQ